MADRPAAFEASSSSSSLLQADMVNKTIAYNINAHLKTNQPQAK